MHNQRCATQRQGTREQNKTTQHRTTHPTLIVSFEPRKIFDFDKSKDD